MKILGSTMPAPTTKALDPTATTKPPPVQRTAPPPPPQSSRGRSPPPSLRALPLRSMSGLPAGAARLLVTTMDGAEDVEFEVCGKVFAAHKLVLAARSPVFREDFFGAAKEEATGYVRICDTHPDTFEALLHYVYTDSLPAAALVPTGGHSTQAAAAAAAVLAQDLVVAADRYGLRRLKWLAERELCRRHDVVITVDTVLPMLALAERHQCWKLKKKCLEFVASSGANARAVMAASDDVEYLARSCPSVVKELVKILAAREATPSSRRPLMHSAHTFYLAMGFILAFVLGMWTLICLGYLEQT